jgi:ankyrin repeat protein
LAAENGHREVVEVLLSKGADIEARDLDGQTALMWVSLMQGPVEMADLLISRGAKVEARDDSGKTALDWAVTMGRQELVELLLARAERKPVAASE